MANIRQTVDLTQGTLSNLIVEDGKLKLPNVNAPTFTRSSIAYKSDGSQVAVNVPRFEAGKFGQGILIEEGTTNLLPSNDAQGKTQFSSNNSSRSSNTLETSFGLNDLYSLKSVQLVVTTNKGFYSPSYPTVVGNVYTFSYYVYNATSTSHNFTARFHFYDGSGKVVERFESNSIPVPAQQWKRISVTATAPSGSTQCRVVGWESGTTSQVGDVYYFDNFQLEQKEYATSWTVGTRQPEVITVPTAGILNAGEGSASVWVYVNDLIKNTSAWRYILAHGTSDTANFIALRHGTDNMWYAMTSNGAGQQSIVKINDTLLIGWHHFAMRWSVSELALFIDGVKVGSVNNPYLPSAMNTNFSIGKWLLDAYGWVNTYIDDLALYNRALSDSEVQAIYSSNQPAPITENTTYALRFDGGLNFGRGGYYISPEYDLSTVGNYVKHRVYWQEDADKEECLVYAKLDNQSDWTQLTNGGSLPIVEGQDLTGRKIQFKVKLLDLV